MLCSIIAVLRIGYEVDDDFLHSFVMFLHSTGSMCWSAGLQGHKIWKPLPLSSAVLNRWVRVTQCPFAWHACLGQQSDYLWYGIAISHGWCSGHMLSGDPIPPIARRERCACCDCTNVCPPLCLQWPITHHYNKQIALRGVAQNCKERDDKDSCRCLGLSLPARGSPLPWPAFWSPLMWVHSKEKGNWTTLHSSNPTMNGNWKRYLVTNISGETAAQITISSKLMETLHAIGMPKQDLHFHFIIPNTPSTLNCRQYLSPLL